MALTKISSDFDRLYLIKGDSWQSYVDGVISSSWSWGAITGVSYNSSTGKLQVSWKVGIGYNSGAKGYKVAGIELWINGSSVWSGKASRDGTWYNETWFNGGSGMYEAGSGTTNINWDGASSQSVSISVKALFDWGWSQDRWNNFNASTASGSYTTYNLPTAPSGSISTSNIGRLTASYSSSFSAGNGCTIKSYSWSISPSATLSAASSSSGTISNLKPNTNYTLSLTVTNSAGLKTTKSTSFTTTGNAPDITDINVVRERTSLTVDVAVDYDTNDSFSYYIIQYAPIDGSATTINQVSPTITGLQPNTTYALNVQVVSSWGRVSDGVGWVGSTTCNWPTNLQMVCTAFDSNSITVWVSADGDTNAPITGYNVYWVGPDHIEHGTSINSNTLTVNNLLVDTNYDFCFMAKNAAGGITSEIETYSTTLVTPQFESAYIADVTPFSLVIGVDVRMEPERQLLYAFSKDDGNSWTPYQESSSYQWTGLTEETTYDFAVRVKAVHESLYAQDTYLTITYRYATPADQASVRVKTANGWKKGKAWLKVGEVWKKAKKVYIKDGDWKIGSNRD